MANTKRWFVINKKTLNVRTTFGTRESARNNKRSTEYIYDSINGKAVR